jgi:hypothetical protein
MNASLISLAALCVLLTGCLKSGDAESPADVGPEALYFEAVGAGQIGSLSDTTETAIWTQHEWDAYRDSLRAPEPFQPVDFDQTMLLMAALPQTSGGYRIQFESVEKEGERITASYVVFAPGPDCMTIMALTLPFQVVAVRRATGDVVFRRRVELESCALD